MSILALQKKRDALAKQLHAVLEADEFDRSESDRLSQEIANVDADIVSFRQALEVASEEHDRNAILQSGIRKGVIRTDDEVDAFNRFLRYGLESLSAEERRKYHQTMSTTTPSEGGYTVPEEVAATIIESLKQFGGMRAVAEVITTASGVDINFPTSDGTNEEGELLGQNAQATTLSPEFGTVPHVIYKFSSKIVAVPFELLQDSAVDIEAFVRRRLVTRLGRITNRLFTVGTGVGQPTGVVTAAGQGVVATDGAGLVDSVNYDSLVDLQHSVDPAYRDVVGGMGGLRFMMHDDTLRVIRKIKDSSGRPIFVPGYEQGAPGGVPDRLLGSGIQVNQNMPIMEASAKSILFGDFSYYVIRDVMALRIRRYDDSNFDTKGQVGFLAMLRSGGNLLQPEAVRFYRNAAS